MKSLDTDGVDMALLEEMSEEQAFDYLRCKYGEEAPKIIEAIKERFYNLE